MPNLNQAVAYKSAFHTKGDASHIATTAIEGFGKGVSHFAKHMANANTFGYQHDVQYHVTNGPNGQQMMPIEHNSMDAEARGALETTERALDIGIDGVGWLVLDFSGSIDPGSSPQLGCRSTASMRVDSAGYLRDESGNIMMGGRINPDGTVQDCSLMSDLERIQIPLSPSQARATTMINFAGILPADNVVPGISKSMAVDVFDSLGITHQLDFIGTKMGPPRVWKFEAKDSMGANVTRSDGGFWADQPDGTKGGVLIAFSETGDMLGGLDVADPKYAAWQEADLVVQGSDAIMTFMSQHMAQNPTITVGDLQAACEAQRDKLFTDNTAKDYEGANETITAAFNGLTTGDQASGTDVEKNGQTKNDKYRQARSDAYDVMLPEFKADGIPDLLVSDWKNSVGAKAGSANSQIKVNISDCKMTGEEYNMESPFQDGCGSAAFDGIEITRDGKIALKFMGQENQPVWQLYLVNFHNNNGLDQGPNNLLSPGAACGTYTMSSPMSANLGATKAEALVQSNVNTQLTLIGANKMARLAKMSSTLLSISEGEKNSVLDTLNRIS